MTDLAGVDGLVRRARRRWITNLLLRQAVMAASAALAGLIVVLLAGTDLLSWAWIGAAAALGIGLGIWHLRRQVPAPYSVAQAIDSRLDLNDTISTAYFYRHVSRRSPSDFEEAIFARADVLASDADLEKAVPFSVPRSLYGMAALGVAATGLFAVRYGISHNLDLKPPLPRMVFDVFHFASKPPQVAKAKRPDQRMEDLLKQFGLSLESDTDKSGQRRNGTNQDAPMAQSEQGEQVAQSSRVSPQPQAGEQEKGEEAGEGLSVPQTGEDGRETGDSQQSGASSQASNGGREQNSKSREENSLISKFRDALQNLMSRMKGQPKSNEGQQSASAQGQRDRRGQDRDPQGQQNGQQSSNAKGMQGSQGQGEMQDGEGADQAAEGGKGKHGGQSSQQAANRDGKSGIGKDDGSKELKEAEQLAAMGKISEIIGKRSQNLTGEVMVEVTSSNQQLRTAYSQQNASHTEAGGDISRDEVPLAYQHYVQQYFEEIRKTPRPKATTPVDTGAKQ